MNFSLTPIVRNILFLNVGLFLADALLKTNLSEWLGLRYIFAPNFQPFQLLTHMFLHGGFGHLLSNMFGLIMFGPLLEELWGSKRFLIFYFFTGIGAALLYSAINYYEFAPLEVAAKAYFQNPNYSDFVSFVNKYASWFVFENKDFMRDFQAQPASEAYLRESASFAMQYYERQSVSFNMIGASGAIFGIITAFGMLFPNRELFLLFPPIPIKAKYFVILYGLYELYAGVRPAAGDNVAHFAHLGGMLFAFIFLNFWNTHRRGFQ